MSETSTRHSGPRGRGFGRGGGRGSFSNRGGRGGSRTTNGTQPDVVDPHNLEEEGEIGELKGKYGSKIGTIKEMFPDWTEQDVAFALDETNGDLESTVERISEGNVPLDCSILSQSHWILILRFSQVPSPSGAK